LQSNVIYFTHANIFRKITFGITIKFFLNYSEFHVVLNSTPVTQTILYHDMTVQKFVTLSNSFSFIKLYINILRGKGYGHTLDKWNNKLLQIYTV